MYLMWIIPLMLIVLFVYFSAAAGKQSAGTPQVANSPTCGSCGEPVQTDWESCPVCGYDLGEL